MYFISGGGGFVFGSSLADVKSPSVGASGSLYGISVCSNVIRNNFMYYAGLVPKLVSY